MCRKIWSGVAAVLGTCAVARGATIPEVEPNDSKATATAVVIACDDVLSGATVGSDVDYWRITTPAAAAPGIYRYRLSVAPAAPHITSIRGLSQTDGVIAPASDVPVQFATTDGAVTNVNQFYGFGAPADVIYRVDAGPLQAAYSVTVSCAAAPIVDFNRALEAGSITLSSSADRWIYDAQFQPLPAVAPNTAARVFAAGTYYIAASFSNLANDQPCPLATNADADRSVLEFPNVVLTSNYNTSGSISVTLRDGFGATTKSATNLLPYDVAWLRFEVTAAPSACCLTDGSCHLATSADCIADGGILHGIGTPCDPSPCEQPRACCRADGSCEMTLVANCNSGWQQGAGSNCASVVCEPVRACCSPNGNCTMRRPQDCTGSGYTSQALGTTCATVTCPSLCLAGDANCDGRVDNFDIDPWVQGRIFGPGGSPPPMYYFSAECWALATCWGDVNGDDAFNNFDVDPFVACIFNLPPPGQPCPR